MENKTEEELRMPLWEHLEELRNILIRILVALFLGACVTYWFSEQIVWFLERPLLGVLPEGQRHLYFTGVADKFVIYFKVSMLCSLLLTSPYLLYQFWGFVAPGLHRHERRFIGPFIFFGCLTFLLGLTFGYCIVVPYGYKFLIEFGSDADLPVITLKSYFDLTLKLMLAVGLLFEMPVILVLLGKFGIITPRFLTTYRRHAMLAIAVISAVVTPSPDAITMVMVMVPLYLLYEISIIAVRLPPVQNKANYRELPSVEKMARHSALSGWEEKIIHPIRVKIVKELVAEIRLSLDAGENCPPESEILARLDRAYQKISAPQLRKVINGTGVVLHTNLGRAPLGRTALDRLADELAGYAALEFDTERGERGSRTGGIEDAMALLCDVPASLVVNNCAAALFLALHVLAPGREVLISRGELVQIGGGFRIPDILESSGAKLVEVGTTNMTSLKDFEKKISSETALILKVHQSNFTISGHTETPRLADLSTLARARNIPLLMDLGSGAIAPLPSGISEPTVGEVLHQGADVVCFSGDKLFGGPQSGFLVGELTLIARLRSAPLYRALRVGKTELFCLEHALRERIAGRSNPTFDLLRQTADEIKQRCEKLQTQCPFAKVVQSTSSVGGGTLPESALPTFCLEITPGPGESFALDLLAQRPAVVVRREKGKVLIDPRTVFADEEPTLVRALNEAWERTCLS